MLSAVVIALIEEGFCRAFLLGGMQRDFRRTTALIASSAIYSAAHLFRAPEKYYVATFEPAVGLRNLIASTGQLSDPGAAIPAFVGLFILGLVLGRAFLLTGTVYFSMGLHGGLVFGLKVWMQCVRRRLLPSWIIGASLAPVISSVSGWALALGVLVLLPRICRDRSEQVSEGTTRARGAAG
jgi:membrane protease YdiL (CAAX protease family)